MQYESRKHPVTLEPAAGLSTNGGSKAQADTQKVFPLDQLLSHDTARAGTERVKY